VGVERFTARGYRVGPVTHVVLLRYRPEVTDETRATVVERFLALASATRDGEPYIVSIVGGSPTGGEGVDGGFHHGFVVTFASEGDRNFYVGEPVLPDELHADPDHAAFKRFAGPLLAPQGALVFDIA
jgi:hypothetical protein